MIYIVLRVSLMSTVVIRTVVPYNIPFSHLFTWNQKLWIQICLLLNLTLWNLTVLHLILTKTKFYWGCEMKMCSKPNRFPVNRLYTAGFETKTIDWTFRVEAVYQEGKLPKLMNHCLLVYITIQAIYFNSYCCFCCS